MIADLKPYSEYKESDLPWLGSVPGHWGQRRMKFLFKERTQKGFPNEPLLAATQSKGVVRKEDYGLRTVTAMNGLENLTLVEVGDFVISLRSFQGGIEVSHARGIISPAYTVLRPRDDIEPGYFKSYFKSADFIRSLTLFVTGIREGQNIDYERLSRAFMPLPPPAEQAAIVRFLDWANGRLERAIRAKRKVIALLGEQKQAIIHRAVTRGLDPSVPLKPSGIPWLGDIPQHWEVRRLKMVLARNDGGVWGSDFAPDGTIVLRSTEQAMDGSWRIDDPAVIRLSESQVQSALLEVGDIVVTKSSGSARHIGKASLVTREIAAMRCCYSNFMQRLRTTPDLAPEYLNLFLNSNTGRMHYQYSSTSTTGLGNLTRETIATLPIPVPDRSEQARVLDGVRKRLEPIDEATSRLTREIELLREYRTRLIADVVTGKLDVRDAATRLPDEALLDTLEEEADMDDVTEAADEEVTV